MSIWNLFSKSSKPRKELEVKKQIKYNNLTIKLYEVDWYRGNVYQNIEAFDETGRQIWIVEKPAYSRHFWDMQIDEENKQLDADSGSSHHYIIDLETGKIIDDFIIK